jgi:enamine deaminase RidA (YjgF/YER057c/UK114 family)
VSKKFYEALARWPACIAAGPFLFFAGQFGARKPGELCTRFSDVEGHGPGAGSSHEWVSRMEAPVGAQAIALYERYRKVFSREGADFSALLRYHIYQRDKRFFPVFDRVRRFYETKPPASTAVGMGRFDTDDAARVCIDAISLRSAGAPSLGERKVLAGASKYAAAAHFSHVIEAGPYLFVAGQIPVDTSRPGAPLIRNYEDIPEEGRFLRVGRSHEDARNGPIAAQTWFTYDLIRQHVEAAGSSLHEIVNLIVYLQDMRDFPTFHRVHERFFPQHAPALTVVEVGEVGHKGTLIEIEPTAVRGLPIRRNAVESSTPAHMSASVEAGGLVFLSGIPGLTANGEPARKLSDLPAAWRKKMRFARAAGNTGALVQAAAVLFRLEERLREMKLDLKRVVHLTLYVNDIDCFLAIAPWLERAFGKMRPALVVLEVPHAAPVADVSVSATAIAWAGKDTPAIYAA